MSLNFDLSTKLMFDARFRQLILEENLERHDEVRLLLACKIDLAKLAVTERLADIEIVERPLPRGTGGLLPLPLVLPRVVLGLPSALRTAAVVSRSPQPESCRREARLRARMRTATAFADASQALPSASVTFAAAILLVTS